MVQCRLTCALSPDQRGGADSTSCVCQSWSSVTSFYLPLLKTDICRFFQQKSGYLISDKRQNFHSSCLFSLFVGAQEITVQIFKRVWTLTLLPWGRITERFSWSSQKYFLRSLWFENFQSDEVEEMGKPVIVRKIGFCTYIVVALNCWHVILFLCCWMHWISTLLRFWQVS